MKNELFGNPASRAFCVHSIWKQSWQTWINLKNCKTSVTDWQRRDAVSEFKNFNYYLLTFKSINFDKIFRRFCSFFRSLISPAEMDPIENAKPKRPFTIVVEGNIGSGKSTFLNQVIIYNYFLSKSKMRY